MADLCADGPGRTSRAALEDGRGLGAHHPGPGERQAQGLLVLHARADRRHAVRPDRAGVGQAQRRSATPCSRRSCTTSTAGPCSPSPTRTCSSAPASSTPAGFEAFKCLEDIVPRPDHKASGEERAWGRRLAKRFGVDKLRRPRLRRHRRRPPTRRASTTRASSPSRIDADVAAFFDDVDAERGDSLIAFGWAMAEFLAKHAVAEPAGRPAWT